MYTYKQIAEAFAAAFVTDTRNDGKKFYKLENEQEWMNEAVMAAHGDRMPSDQIYKLCARIADDLTEYGEDGPNDDDLHEIADNAVPAYNATRTAWLADHLDNAGYCDSAREEGLVADDADMFTRIGIGMYQQAREVAQALHDAVTAQVEDQTDDEEEEPAD